MSFAAPPPGARILVVGNDAEVCAALHPAADAAGHALWCVPSPAQLDGLLRLAAPQLVVLALPAAPDATWGNALAAAAAAARLGVRVIVVAPAREVVEPLAAVAGAERAFSRAEVLARPASVIERLAALEGPAPVTAASPAPAGPGPSTPPPPAALTPAPAPAAPRPTLTPTPTPAVAAPQPAAGTPPAPVDAGVARYRFDPPALVPPGSVPRPPRRVADLASLIDEELEGEPQVAPRLSRVEVNVSLVSEHNFYVGATRRVDSGGVFVATVMPPPIGTRLQLRLGLADGRKIDLDGEVAFIREKSTVGVRQPSGCGVRLIGVPGWALEAIERFVHARPPIVWVVR